MKSTLEMEKQSGYGITVNNLRDIAKGEKNGKISKEKSRNICIYDNGYCYMRFSLLQ